MKIDKAEMLLYAVANGSDYNKFTDENKTIYADMMIDLLKSEGLDLDSDFDKTPFTEKDLKEFEFIQRWKTKNKKGE